MNYERVWKLLEELMVDLMQKGVTIPKELADDLKSARTLINIYKIDLTALEILTEIELYIDKVEPNLLYLAESDVGKKYAFEWQKRITNARMEKVDEQVNMVSRFISEVPKGEHWIRIRTSEIITNEDLRELLKKYALFSKLQKDDYLLIYGKQDRIKAFIREISKKIERRNLN